MTPILLLSRDTIFKEYGIYFAEPYLVIRNIKDHKDADLLYRILTSYQKYCSAYTAAKASEKYLDCEQVGETDCRRIVANLQRKAFDSIYLECLTLLKNSGSMNKTVELELSLEKPVFPMSAVTEELPKLEFDHDKML